jgi:hypothetical protein
MILSSVKYLPLSLLAECLMVQDQVDMVDGDMVVLEVVEGAEVEVAVEVAVEDDLKLRMQVDGYLTKIGRPCQNTRKRKYVTNVVITQNGKSVNYLW